MRESIIAISRMFKGPEKEAPYLLKRKVNERFQYLNLMMMKIGYH